MIHPDTELSFINPVIGFGLVATKLIPKGTITWARDPLDLVFTADEYRQIEGPRKDFLYKYCFVDGRGRHILCWDHGRFVNHSCEANCLAPGFDFEIAVRDIHPGEQLTDDYGMLNPDRDFHCSCDATECRKIIHPSDSEQMSHIWDDRVRQVFPKIQMVDQPLWEFVEEKNEILRALNDLSLLPSCIVHFFQRRMIKN